MILPRQSSDALPITTDRRRFLRWMAGAGAVGIGTLSAGALSLPGVALGAEPPEPPPPTVPDDAIGAAADLIGLQFTPEERKLMNPSVAEHRDSYRKLRGLSLDNSVPPAFTFNPVIPGLTAVAEGMGPGGYRLQEAVRVTLGAAPPGRGRSESPRQPAGAPSGVPRGKLPDGPDGPLGIPARGYPDRRKGNASGATRPTSDEDLAYLPAHQLGELIRTRQLSSVELTRAYLSRINRLNGQLLACITVTDDLALRQAQQADEEIRADRWRGPLHGVPYGVKDLIDTQGIATTWGAEPFRGRVPREDATVVKRLRDAGAVLLAKTAVGALAMGDIWFGGTTKNPWKLDQGSSGSSAGSASGTVAALFGFAIGTETLGSIVSPSTRCGATGLRPTFGRVARTGAMALSWTMDKLGPIGRSVYDLPLVFDAIRGADGLDATVIDAPFSWDAGRALGEIRVGYDRAAFEEKRRDPELDNKALDVLRGLGINLVPITLPDMPVGDILFGLEAEAAAAFDDLTRSGQDDQLKAQDANAWPNIFRAARLIPAVEYIQAARARTLLMRRMDAAMADVDCYVHPTFGGNTLLTANLTGHPTVVMPNGFRPDGTPASICFTGRLFGEAATLRVAAAYEDATGWNRRRPGFG